MATKELTDRFHLIESAITDIGRQLSATSGQRDSLNLLYFPNRAFFKIVE